MQTTVSQLKPGDCFEMMVLGSKTTFCLLNAGRYNVINLNSMRAGIVDIDSVVIRVGYLSINTEA